MLRVTHEDGHSEGLNETECKPVIDLRYVYVKKINSSEVNECKIGGDEKLVIIQLCGLCDLFAYFLYLLIFFIVETVIMGLSDSS